MPTLRVPSDRRRPSDLLVLGSRSDLGLRWHLRLSVQQDRSGLSRLRLDRMGLSDLRDLSARYCLLSPSLRSALERLRPLVPAVLSGLARQLQTPNQRVLSDLQRPWVRSNLVNRSDPPLPWNLLLSDPAVPSSRSLHEHPWCLHLWPQRRSALRGQLVQQDPWDLWSLRLCPLGQRHLWAPVRPPHP